MIALRYRITTVQPLLVPGLLGEPNSKVSFPYIPGTQIRGALIGAYLKKHSTDDLVGDAEGHRRFFSDAIRYLNAYPEGPDGERMLPTPLSWHVPKRRKQPIYDFALSDPPEKDSEEGNPPKRKQLSTQFCALRNGTVKLFDPQRQINVHTQRGPVKGRATQDKGEVFRYNALAADQRFIGMIILEDEAQDDLAALKDLLRTGDFWIGGSRTAGYGQVKVEINGTDKNWNGEEKDVPSQEIAAEEKFTIRLLSDALIRDPQTGQHTNDLVKVLEHTLKVKLTRKKAFWETAPVGGFNRKWGLPLPQEMALKAGSVFRLSSEQPIPQADIQRLIAQGIGERRVEGFGRMAFNWLTQEEYEDVETWNQGEESVESESLSDETDRKIARMMVERIYRARLDRWLAAEVNKVEIRNRPKNSQLSQFRLAAQRSIQRDFELAPLKEHLEAVRDRKTSREQFQAARVDNGPMDRWIDDQLKSHRKLLRQDEEPAEIGGVTLEQDRRNELAREYTVRLIDRVLHKAMRMSQ